MGTQPLSYVSCPNCRASLPAEVRFCHHCGTATVALPPQAAVYYPLVCRACGGDGSRLEAAKVVCPDCRWLRPLAPGWAVDPLSFMWSADATAMDTLRSLGPITSLARTVSDSLGRSWFESTLNGVRLHERQMPDIYWTAVRAARILGMARMPEVYLSGEAMWDSMTLGSDQAAIVVLGTVLANLKGDDLLFVIAREMGHAKAGHALWTTLMRFFLGHSSKRSVLGGGILSAISPTKLVENAIDLPLMAWARQAEITADRAGMIAVGSESVARRVLLSWALRSFPLFQRIDLDAWMEQETASDSDTMQLSEWTMSSTPYIARRLKLMREWAATPHLRQWRAAIEHVLPPEPATPAITAKPSAPAPTPTPDSVRLVCPKCKTGLLVPRQLIESKDVVNVRCPNRQCGNVLAIRKKAAAEPPRQTEADSDE